ncbi:MAG: hypothetical protein JSS86_17515 [Cyanobacteria bacterium SZAS LIN-2]|nr:hypothetical protein [Cyanobacteria bacterium SZAS LIN-3]MBS1998128.1 hypothetical protein [Cyanobacteria bacterium SZAS LIN-2]MBS2008088.1 hypothetical protein [Cyanobacteria bacterium SZAS TMP-1]
MPKTNKKKKRTKKNDGLGRAPYNLAVGEIDGVIIKPGSFLARTGGMVPTVRLGRRAAEKIS